MAARQQVVPSRGPTRRHEQTDDLTELVSISEESIVACLRDRYLLDLIYTSLGPSALVAINPHKFINANSDQTLASYSKDYRNTQEMRDILPPHIFGLAGKAYFDMRRTGRDQSILMSGETGSGKSELRRLLIRSFIDLSVTGPGKKGAKLMQQIPNAEFVLESFGNARTLHNANASRFGKYTELQFSDRGRLCGAKTLDYYLERSRVAGPSPGERNFHVFYYLIAGATPEERQHLRLAPDASAYRLLGARGSVGVQLKGGEANDDRTRFEQLKQAFKLVGMSKRLVAQVCQLVAAILHVGNLEFYIDHDKNPDAAIVRNWDVLETVSEFLGVRASALEEVFNCKTAMVQRDVVTVFLDAEGASANRDDFAKSLYSLLFAWLNEHINERLCRDDFANFIGILDLPGFQNLSGFGARLNSLDQFCVNFSNERLQNWILQSTFERQTAEYAVEGISSLIPSVQYFDNSECVRMLSTTPGGLIHIMDDQTKKMGKKTDHTMVEAMGKRWNNHPSFSSGGQDRTGFPTFIVSHYNGPTTYSAESFLEKNADAINPDFVSLLRGSTDADIDESGSSNTFIRGLFASNAIATQVHPRDQEVIVAAQQPVKPMRAPSTRRKGGRLGARLGAGDDDGVQDEKTGEQSAPQIRSVVGEFKATLDVLFETFDETKSWIVYALTPNDVQLPNQLESRGLKAQVRSVGLTEFAKRASVSFEVSMTHAEFCERYEQELIPGYDSATDAVISLRERKEWREKDLAVGKYKIFVSPRIFRLLEDELRVHDVEEKRQNQELETDSRSLVPGGVTEDPFSPYRNTFYNSSPVQSPFLGGSTSNFAENYSSQALPLVANAQRDEPDMDYDSKTMRSYDDYAPSRFNSQYDDNASNVGTEAYAPSKNMFGNMEKTGLHDQANMDPKMAGAGETTEVIGTSSARRKWVALVWLLTWWCPSFLLAARKKFKRPDVRQAWREKLAINVIIWFIMGCAVFVIAILGNLICPKEYIYSTGELSQYSYDNDPSNELVSIRGEIFDLTGIAKTHLTIVPVVTSKSVLQYGGIDATSLFPVQVSALCNGIDGYVSPWVQINSLNSSSSQDTNSGYHDFRAFTNDSRPDWYYEQMVYMRYNFRKGFVGILPSTIRSSATSGAAIAIYDNHVYDVSEYVKSPPYFKTPSGTQVPANSSTQFMSPKIISLFQQKSGTDITKSLNALASTIGQDVLDRQLTCLRNLFLTGLVDNRQSAQCKFAEYILLALSIFMVSIIGFKFLGALYFGSTRLPESQDKFIICQVPCYTEGESSLKKTIDSLAKLKYDDKRKLITVICDGNIVGAGNDRSTPRIVLDILGVDPNLTPESLSFLSLGEGQKQHNMGKIYSGLYECAGHVVPYIVIVKCGRPGEGHRPGNRGKRDSQMTVMHFLNKVHYNTPMNPMELEMYHQIKNVIGVNPSFYEYIFTVDADTTVHEDSLSYLVASMVNDKKVIACCGETSIANAKQSLITMMQVYEYFISHHLAKSFESLFGSVTCLPGCFSIYRLRTPDSHKPLFIADEVISGYSENRVDTLHLKNLLHLGEDRYLTTLLLTYFPTYKTTFVRPAHAQTVAPDEWKVLISQRRRWINSTIHNLAELVFIDKLCGFCCFSMRFVVFVDLVSTITAPVTVAYIVYLLYLVIGDGQTIPTLSIIMLAAIYGLQAAIFLLRGKWDMIGWMVFYILAVPIFSFALPIWSFWYMDDFSWGSTRVVVGEKGKKLVIHDEGHFDPKSIPLKTWNEYENELWERESNKSVGSWVPPSKRAIGTEAGSLYGRETVYDAPVSRHESSYDRYQDYSPEGMYGSRPASVAGGGHYTPSLQPSGLQHSYRPPVNSFYGQQPTDGRSVRGTQYGEYFNDNGLQPGGGANYQPGSSQLQLLDPSDHVDGPSDHDLNVSVRRILANSDLNLVTKKGVRKDLESEYGVELSSRKEAINQFIEQALMDS
ncbi:glycosyltransferase family 2 protein [Phaffia rhodozyma]|uniref:chitin synthase n=1 Tax=Phaffia rhodozyma TaxID=264483 RepID=A0A0F7SQE5_PHARH|nr:glycosyltransferase family 2 protein [Phaffia rhodozyma]